MTVPVCDILRPVIPSVARDLLFHGFRPQAGPLLSRDNSSWRPYIRMTGPAWIGSSGPIVCCCAICIAWVRSCTTLMASICR